ncbi:MAG TPA: exostosin family protein [Lacunisphaera sp.]|jgi:hypothetical protein
MKIYASPCGTSLRTVEFDMLHQLHTWSTPRRHEWCENPEEADIIFLTNAQQKWGSELEKNVLPKRFPEKSFALSEQWEPPFLLAGIYANAPRSPFGRGRFRTGSYILHHPDFHNTFVDAYDYRAAPSRPNPDLLASFLGRQCHPVRDRLFAMNFAPDEILVEDTSTFDAFTHTTEGKLEKQRRYFEICLRSKFILCPRGAGPNSIRLFEALKLGIAPVIISDDWIPCEGPQWEKFAIFIPENEVENTGEIMRRFQFEYAERGRNARLAYENFFSPETYFNYLVDSAASALSSRVVPERLFITLWPAYRLLRGVRRRTKKLVGIK